MRCFHPDRMDLMPKSRHKPSRQVELAKGKQQAATLGLSSLSISYSKHNWLASLIGANDKTPPTRHDLTDHTEMRVRKSLQPEDLPTRDSECVIKRRKKLAIQRYLGIAEQYIANVVLGESPKREGR